MERGTGSSIITTMRNDDLNRRAMKINAKGEHDDGGAVRPDDKNVSAMLVPNRICPVQNANARKTNVWAQKNCQLLFLTANNFYLHTT